MKKLSDILMPSLIEDYLIGLNDLSYYSQVLGHTVERHIYNLPVNRQRQELKDLRNELNNGLIWRFYTLGSYSHIKDKYKDFDLILEEVDEVINKISLMVTYIKNTNYIMTLYRIQKMLMVDGLYDDHDVSNSRVFEILDISAAKGNIDAAYKKILEHTQFIEKNDNIIKGLETMKSINVLLYYTHTTLEELKNSVLATII